MRKKWGVVALLGLIPAAYAALPYDAIVRTHSAKYGFDPLFIHAVIQQESRHNPRICSRVRACGLMQLMPGTALELGVRNVFDPNQNVAGGTLYLRRLQNQFGNIPNTLRAYNWGPGNMRNYLRRLRNGQNPKMPPETAKYVPGIARHYYSYGGKGNMFSGMNAKGSTQNGGKSNTSASDRKTDANPNRAKTEQALQTVKACPKPQIPDQEATSGNAVAITVPAMPGGAGKAVFDPSKVVQWTQAVSAAKQQLEVMKGQYDSLTKGMAGLNLLQNISTIGGEIPNIYQNGREDTPQWGQAFDGNLYRQLAEMKAADTGIYANGHLKGNVHAHAQAINHSYVESEIAWAKVNCSVGNFEALIEAAGKTKTLKQAKDVQNAIDLETAMLAANQAKIRANIVAMQSRYQSFRLTASQAYSAYLSKRGTVKN